MDPSLLFFVFWKTSGWGQLRKMLLRLHKMMDIILEAISNSIATFFADGCAAGIILNNALRRLYENRGGALLHGH
ncbi:Hypothetical protein GbCGDNIH3_7172 [Granulibacter bethesdensis]|uniref:Uncharacterized protein n=1 Tax=Granulibacter bethesdensis TaxID=364410 RepID=A0AAN0RCJ7_9PROT|nr:Hypothetical protein GbCGDNIH3_7172 [Granulibacter bethesdensis]